MKQTMLETVNMVLTNLNLEPVNDIDDTAESQSVINIMKKEYYSILGLDNWPHLEQSFALTSYNSTDKPVIMLIPDGVQQINMVRYRMKDGSYKNMEMVKPDEFLERSNTFTGSYTEYPNMVKKINTPLRIITNKDPSYCTSFDDENIIFDSFDSSLESTLQESKALCKGAIYPDFVFGNTEIIDMPSDMFWSMYIPKVHSSCSIKINKQSDSTEEKAFNRGRLRMYNESHKINGQETYSYVAFGRR